MRVDAMQVLEFPLEYKSLEAIEVQMPRRARILSCEFRNGVPTLWVSVMCTDLNDVIPRRFFLIPTGAEFKGWSMKYVKTLQTEPLVFHLFENTED